MVRTALHLHPPFAFILISPASAGGWGGGGGTGQHSLCLRAVSARECCVDDTLHGVYSARRRVGQNRSDVRHVIPSLRAVRRHESMLQRDNLVGANGGVLQDNKRSIGREEVCEGCRRCWIFSLGIESEIEQSAYETWSCPCMMGTLGKSFKNSECGWQFEGPLTAAKSF